MRKKLLPAFFLIMLFIPAILFAVKISELNRWAKTGLIHAMVQLHGVDIGGMTKEEAHAALQKKFQSELNKKNIRFIHDQEERLRLSFTQVDARYDFTESIETAWAYGRTYGSRFRARFSAKPYVVDTPMVYEYNAKILDDFVQALCDKTNMEPKNAALSYKNGQVTVIPGKYGRMLDDAAVLTQAQNIVSSQESGEVVLPYTSIKPAFTSHDLDFPITRLGRFETEYQNPEDDPRIKNIRIASGRIHNQTIYPGEVFSTSKYIASNSPDIGYVKAIVLVNGLPVEDVGGGICQVVTTLYNAVLYAELPVTERHNHSAKVGYVDYGFDATVAGDYYDLKFKNDTAYPLLVVSGVSNGRLVVSLYGHEKRPSGRSLEFKSELTEVLAPEPQIVKKEPTIPSGELWVYTEAKDGYKYELYKYIYENGTLIDKEKVNNSTYKPVQGVVGVSDA